MKRKELEKKLRQAGCYLKREGASHRLINGLETPSFRTIQKFIF
jgi:predicted RNA binding protein YcfA (HicA-like mRNA interferase family)